MLYGKLPACRSFGWPGVGFQSSTRQAGSLSNLQTSGVENHEILLPANPDDHLRRRAVSRRPESRSVNSSSFRRRHHRVFGRHSVVHRRTGVRLFRLFAGGVVQSRELGGGQCWFGSRHHRNRISAGLSSRMEHQLGVGGLQHFGCAVADSDWLAGVPRTSLATPRRRHRLLFDWFVPAFQTISWERARPERSQ